MLRAGLCKSPVVREPILSSLYRVRTLSTRTEYSGHSPSLPQTVSYSLPPRDTPTGTTTLITPITPVTSNPDNPHNPSTLHSGSVRTQLKISRVSECTQRTLSLSSWCSQTMVGNVGNVGSVGQLGRSNNWSRLRFML